jgi:hypothetical protein
MFYFLKKKIFSFMQTEQKCFTHFLVGTGIFITFFACSVILSCGMDRIVHPDAIQIRSGHLFLIMAGRDVDETEQSSQIFSPSLDNKSLYMYHLIIVIKASNYKDGG